MSADYHYLYFVYTTDVRVIGELATLLPDFTWVSRLAVRALDIMLGAVLLVFALPVIAVIGLIMKLLSPDVPVITGEWRQREDGQAVRLYRFQCIIVNGAELRALINLITGKAQHDTLFNRVPLAVRFGRFLHRSRLAMLPRVFNLVRGDISLFEPELKLSNRFHR